MKKIIALALNSALVLGFCGCAGSTQESSQKTSSPEGSVAGGWTVQEANAASLTEEDQEVFEEGAGQWNGGELKAVALLGTQIVAGTNYCYLAYSSLNNDYVLAYIYRDLDKNVLLTKVTDLDLNAESYGEADSTENLEGGWEIAETTYAVPSEDDQKVLEDALAELTGAGYGLVAVLGTQVVSGTNYKMVCIETTVTAEPVVSLAVVTVYQDLEGKCRLSSVVPLPIAALSEAE